MYLCKLALLLLFEMSFPSPFPLLCLLHTNSTFRFGWSPLYISFLLQLIFILFNNRSKIVFLINKRHLYHFELQHNLILNIWTPDKFLTQFSVLEYVCGFHSVTIINNVKVSIPIAKYLFTLLIIFLV